MVSESADTVVSEGVDVADAAVCVSVDFVHPLSRRKQAKKMAVILARCFMIVAFFVIWRNQLRGEVLIKKLPYGV